MDAYPDHGGVRLTQSYTDQAGLFSTAFTYDNALAILAHLAARTGEGLTRARALGDALLHAQLHDPAYDDGRLRQAYNVGPYTFYDGSPQPDGFVRPDGTVNVGTQFGFTGTAVGDMAWAGIALSALALCTGAGRFRTGAVRIGEWIERTGRTDEPLGGYTFGVDGANQRLPFTSTEHNTDLVCLFGRLAQLTGARVWLERRARAEAFVRRMWEPAGGFFYTGTNDASPAIRTASESGGEYASGSKVRPRPPRRAGSRNTASWPASSASGTSPTSARRTVTRSARPRAAALASATAQVNGSRSTASTRRPALARAMASPPTPQHRSATVRAPSAAIRSARQAATGARVACSTPSAVKYIRSASGPNFAAARCRSRAWPMAAETTSAGWSRRSRVAAVSSSAGVSSRSPASRPAPRSVSSARKTSTECADDAE
jgi:hypothetical protein